MSDNGSSWQQLFMQRQFGIRSQQENDMIALREMATLQRIDKLTDHLFKHAESNCKDCTAAQTDVTVVCTIKQSSQASLAEEKEWLKQLRKASL